MRVWAGSDDDVIEALAPHVWPLPARILVVYVKARGSGLPAVAEIFRAHFGDLPYVDGSRAAIASAEIVERIDGIVAYFRSKGDNLLGAMQ